MKGANEENISMEESIKDNKTFNGQQTKDEELG